MTKLIHIFYLLITYLTSLSNRYFSQIIQNCSKIADYWVHSQKERTSSKQQTHRRSPAKRRLLKPAAIKKPRTPAFSNRIWIQNGLNTILESSSDQDDAVPLFYNHNISSRRRADMSESYFTFPSVFRETNNQFIYPQQPPPFGVHQRSRLEKSYMSSTSIKLAEYQQKNTEYIIQKTNFTQEAGDSGKRILAPGFSKQKIGQNQFWTLTPYSEPRVKSSVHKRQKLSPPFEPTKLTIIFENLAY